MPCGSARIRTSLSSTTTSDPRRSPKPLDSRVDPGVSRFSGGLIGPDSAGIPQEIRSRCRLMPIAERPLRRSTRVRAEVDSMSSRA
jgi:hypothetical protein